MKVVGERHLTPLPNIAARDLATYGLDVPLLATVGEPRAVVLGTRRAAALKSIVHPDSRLPVMCASKASEVRSWMAFDRVNRAVNEMPWSWVQRGRLMGWLLRDIQVRGDASIVDIAAEYLGVKPSMQLRNAWYLVRDFDLATGEKKARIARAIEAVERGEYAPQSAVYRLTQGGFPDPDAPQERPAMTAAQQQRAIATLGQELAGLKLGIEALGVLHPDLTNEQRAALLAPLAEFRTVFVRLTRALAPTRTQGSDEG